MTQTPRFSRTLPLLTAALAAAAAAGGLDAGSAKASDYVPSGKECTRAVGSGNGMGPALADGAGYAYETASSQSWFGGRPSQYAILSDVKAGASLFGRFGVDAYDDWGDLFVGSSQSEATQYVDSDPLGCTAEPSGQLAFPAVELGGLTVQRKLFAPKGSGSGLRLVQSVTNPGASPVATNVFVGDLTTTLGKGTLGSDLLTRIEATSSGDATISTADRWAVTSDGIVHSDPVLAHVWDGEGGQTRASLVRSGAQIGTVAISGLGSLWTDQFGYGWKDVQLAPGETASFVSWEIPRVDAAGGADESLAAKAAALSRASAPAEITYAGMTAVDIASVRNWAKPPARIELAPPTSAQAGTDTVLRASGVDFGVGLSQCAPGTLSWDFGDGTSATGPVVSHAFPQGPAQVTVRATGVCGGTASAHVDFAVAPAAAEPVDVTPTPSPTPAPSTERAPTPAAAPIVPAGVEAPAAPLAPAVLLTAPDRLTASTIARKGVGVTLEATAPGAVRLVLSGGGIKVVKRLTLKPGEIRTPTFHLTPTEAAKVRRTRSLEVRAKLTLAGGAEVITTRTISVRR